ncbi:hypothetical protein CP557_09115 [Natrinema ejinorense]|uniref:Uncharacterized protein n=1 Tax=Natrinema ejinorense TaxID=373386 RepID=A0A2A5QV22_9EURY|nr:hypothetical protein CP557_09115 [Natrinema ejinorense]
MGSIHTAGQNDVKIGRSAVAVTGGDGHEFATDFVLTSVRQYHERTWTFSSETITPSPVTYASCVGRRSANLRGCRRSGWHSSGGRSTSTA